jgi:hypothetical protein
MIAFIAPTLTLPIAHHAGGRQKHNKINYPWLTGALRLATMVKYAASLPRCFRRLAQRQLLLVASARGPTES